MLWEAALHWVQLHGSPALGMLLMLGIVGLPLPDEALLTFAGYLIYRGQLHVVPTALSAVLGSVCGITLSYGIGRWLGHGPLHRYGHYLHLTPQRLERTHRWFERFGRWLLLVGYFIPGVRHVVAILAGAGEMSYHSFAIFAYIGAVLWCTTFLFLGYSFGQEWHRIPALIHRHGWMVTMAALLVVALVMLLRRLYRRRLA